MLPKKKKVDHLIHVAAIDSPGLTSCVAIAEYTVDILKSIGAELRENPEFNGKRENPHFFRAMNDEEKNEYIKAHPEYGRIVCRCETVTEGEILDTFSWPIPPCSIDGIKRRTNAGRGRCQGGFCGPKVFDILLNNLHVPFNEIYQDKTGSQVVVEKTKEGK